MPESAIGARDLASALEAVRTASPLVQCLTNIVVAEWTANVLLATGLAPAMVDNEQEAPAFAAVAGAVLINLGTPYTDTAAAMRLAADAARESGTPWVLDPVAAGGLEWRTGLALDLLERGPRIVRGNASEVLALGGGVGGRGVDATDSPEAALDSAAATARSSGAVLAVSGPVDLLTDGHRVVRLANGSPLLSRVTGVGCALGALMAGFAAVVDDPLLAAAGATATLTVAADRAAQQARGPGSFAVLLLDELALLTSEDVEVEIRLS